MSWTEKFLLALRWAGGFAAGALVTAALAALAGALLRHLLERGGHQLDRWRRVWFHPERELVHFVEALLLLGWVLAYGERSGLPRGALLGLYAVWALHLVADAHSYAARRRARHSTRALHERGFFLLDYSPLPVRLAVVALATGAGIFLPPLRWLLGRIMEPLARITQGWFF